MKRILVAIIRFYQGYLSPLKPPTCRFYPTCSNYALEAVMRHGAFKGGWLAVKRISKCHPFHPGGFDPVPAEKIGRRLSRGERRGEHHKSGETTG